MIEVVERFEVEVCNCWVIDGVVVDWYFLEMFVGVEVDCCDVCIGWFEEW